ncbi:MAG: nicotinate (nicotinamide) nucleotide adenylyltransferase [Oscillospiraceae bacterium]|jgi:nicotinate-nucleotide adenylyltransferase|nr:nicotinate (nicotinamide) nucleotide adenylyltransferase [Oscillospiraceae bacterium]
MKTGLFGGSFNPPHLGHLRAAEFFARAYALDRVLVIPAAAPPLKAAPAGASNADRLALCRRTFPAGPFDVCDWELRRPGPSYTIDTLRQARALWPEDRLFLLVGEDQRAQFRQWKDWREILGLAQLAALPRSGQGLSGFVPLEISSTQIRRMLAAGEDASRYLSPSALKYILERKLYGSGGLP